MGSKTDRFEYDFMRHVFNGVAIPSINTSGGTTSLWLGLHTADPGDAGSTAAEGGYTQYDRILVDRSSAAGGWAVTSGAGSSKATVSPTSAMNFPQNLTTSTGTFTHVSVYKSSGSTGSSALYTGTVTPNINFSQNVTPQITSGSSITED